MTSSPPTTSDSLLARATVLPAWSAASVGPSPALPTSALTTKSPSVSRASCSAAFGPTMNSTPLSWPRCAWMSRAASSSAIATCGGRNSRICPTNSSWFMPAADRPTTLNRSGLRRTTSSAWVPIDPVAPRMPSCLMPRSYPALGATPLSGPNITSSEHDTEQQERRRRHEQQGIDPVEHPAVTGQQRPHVLDADVALEQRLREVAERGGDRDHQPERDRCEPSALEHA